jgi:hypothetical protein
MWQIVHLVIEKFKIQSDVYFEIVKSDDIAYNKLFNLLVVRV